MDRSRGFSSLSAGLLARKGEAIPAMESFHTAPVSRLTSVDDAVAAGAAPHAERKPAGKGEKKSKLGVLRLFGKTFGADDQSGARQPAQAFQADAAKAEEAKRAIAARVAETLKRSDLENRKPEPAAQSEPRPAVQPRPAEEGPSAPALQKAPPPPASASCAAAEPGASCAMPVDADGNQTPRRRAKVTVRLETPDFLRLKLASAQLQRTAQDLMSTGLDKYLSELGVESIRSCRCLNQIADAFDSAREHGEDKSKTPSAADAKPDSE